MVQRKYLILLLIILSNNALASVWFPKVGKFKIHYSHYFPDPRTKGFAHRTENRYVEEVQGFQKIIDSLRPIYQNEIFKRDEILMRQSYKYILHKDNNNKIPFLITEQDKWESDPNYVSKWVQDSLEYDRHNKIPFLITEQDKWEIDYSNIPKWIQDSLEDDTPRIQDSLEDDKPRIQDSLEYDTPDVQELYKTNIEAIIKLEEENFYKQVSQYRFWQNHYGNNFSLEYGLSENKAIGLELKYEHTKFLGKRESHDSLGIFSKFKIGEFKNQKFAFKTTLIREQHPKRSPEYYTEWSLLSGRSGSLAGLNTFVDSFVSIATCVSENCQNQGWYSIGATEGVKLPYDFVLTNHSMYQTWLFEDNITYFTFKYNRFKLHKIKKLEIFYEQISIAKKIKMPNLHKSEINFQLSYFFKQNLKYPQHPITGLVFSTWLEI